MSASAVGASANPALFRQHAFEDAWLIPLIESVTVGVDDQSVSQWLLHAVLAAEGVRWLRLGAQVGYFVEASLPDVLDTVPIDYARFLIEAYPVDIGLNPVSFGRILWESVEELTPERLEFLELMFFADTQTFGRRIGDVRELSEALERRPWLIIPPAAVDRIAWALEGADLVVDPFLTPARWRRIPPAWRGLDYHEAWYSKDGGPQPLIRKQEVDSYRNVIARAMQWCIEYEQTPTHLRGSFLTKAADDTGLEDGVLPPWAQELGRD
jgi:hypothetical protein